MNSFVEIVMSNHSHLENIKIDLSDGAFCGISALLLKMQDHFKVVSIVPETWMNSRSSGAPVGFYLWLIAVLQNARDEPEFFPKGKWATIQQLEALVGAHIPQALPAEHFWTQEQIDRAKVDAKKLNNLFEAFSTLDSLDTLDTSDK